MPAPPRKGETQKMFMSRCISHYIKKEGKPKDQAAAICGNMWRKKHGGKPPEKKGELSKDPVMAKLIELLLPD